MPVLWRGFSREVSILVVLDVVLEANEVRAIRCKSGVSILVVLDVVLEDRLFNFHSPFVPCFNPCCAGCSSGSFSIQISRFS